MRDDFPFSPSNKLSAIFSLSTGSYKPFPMKLAASYLLGHPDWHRPDPGLCQRCEEGVETTKHALLLCLARQHARGSFLETLNFKSACMTLQTEGLEGLIARVEEFAMRASGSDQ